MASKPPKQTPLTLYSAIPNQGLFSIGDSSGRRRWINAGGEMDGWKVGQYDAKTNTLSIARGNKTEYLKIGPDTAGKDSPALATPSSVMVIGKGNFSELDYGQMKDELSFREKTGMTIEEYNHGMRYDAFDLGAMNKMMNTFKAMNQGVPVATPTVEPSERKMYRKLNEDGSIELHYYEGELPDDALREGIQ